MFFIYISILVFIFYSIFSFLLSSKPKKTIVILYGGGFESEVSKLSASNIASIVIGLGYDLSLLKVRLHRLPKNFYETNYIEDKLLQIDNPIVLNMVHGEWGEDGAAQRLMEDLNIPYFGSSAFASRIGFYKNEFYEYISRYDIAKIPKWDFLTKSEYLSSQWAINFPHIVKLPISGSSIGVHYISNAADIVKLSMDWDNESKMIVQEFIGGMEVGLAVLNGKTIGGVIPKYKGAILTYEDKYSENSSNLESIDTIPEQLKDDLLKSAEQVFKKCNCSGFVLIEFRLNRNKDWILIEINTAPGMTKKSYIPNSFGETQQKEMVRIMINEACRRGSIWKVGINTLRNLLLFRFLNIFSRRLLKRFFWINFP